ncbi:MAG: pyridoxal-phosphate dependent enzyme [Pseudomonadota bacterium]
MRAGNHAQGVAYHATRLGIASTIVMPKGTPFNKVKRTEDFGTTVITHGTGFDESMAFTLEMAERDGMTLIHPVDDPAVVAGPGTVALEMLEEQPDLDVIVIPVGGAGLISGVAAAIKALSPEIEVIGAQAHLFDAVKSAFYGSPIDFAVATLAKGIAVKALSEANLVMIRKHLDRIESVSEADIEEVVLDLLSHE